MLQVNFIENNKDLVINGLGVRGFKEIDLVETIIKKDTLRRNTQSELDKLLAERNQASKVIGKLFSEGKREEAEQMKNRVTEIKAAVEKLNEALNAAKQDLQQALVQLPNIPHPSVPPGNTDADNEVFKAWEGELPNGGEAGTPHWELGKKFNLLDFDLGVKITGSGFPVFLGKGAKLERSLISFFLDEATKAGYLEVVPPLMVNSASAYGTGQLPDKEGQMYHITEDELYLIPTAEVPITNIYRDTILKESDFPIKLCGYTPCFRREAGSYGKDVRGLNRVHQFDKVEIVRFEHPEKSYAALEDMLLHVESLLDRLELPYRILRLCGGDLGFTSALTFDFEVWAGGQGRWLEVSSVSNFETFQANRLKLRYKDANGKTNLAHTLNGSALALARIVAALLENNFDGQVIRIPEVLQPYTGFDVIE
ncbi:MAG: serine--tRNA ligase [Bacteroidota bacterium]